MMFAQEIIGTLLDAAAQQNRYARTFAKSKDPALAIGSQNS